MDTTAQVTGLSLVDDGEATEPLMKVSTCARSDSGGPDWLSDSGCRAGSEPGTPQGRAGIRAGHPGIPRLVVLPIVNVELVAVGIGQDHVAVLADLKLTGTEGNQPLHLRSLIAFGRHQVEALPPSSELRGDGPASSRDLGAALRRLDRCLLVLIPHQRPAQGFAPEQADLPCAVAGELPEEAAPSEE